MDKIEIESLDDRYIISIGKNAVSRDIIIEFLERLEIEDLAQKVGFDANILEIGEELNSNWWKLNKARFIKESA